MGECIFIQSCSARRIYFEINPNSNWFQKKFVGPNKKTTSYYLNWRNVCIVLEFSIFISIFFLYLLKIIDRKWSRDIFTSKYMENILLCTLSILLHVHYIIINNLFLTLIVIRNDNSSLAIFSYTTLYVFHDRF